MSEIRTDTISAANGTDPVTLTKQSAAKAWLHYSDGGTAVINSSFNIASLTDVSSGNYQPNFSSSFSSSSYCVLAGGAQGSYNVGYESAPNTASRANIWIHNGQDNATGDGGFTAHGDLA